MQVFELKGEVRTDLGKKANKALRKEEKVPCVIYGGEENVHFVVAEKEFNKLLFTPNTYIINLTLGDKVMKAVLRETQFHPVSDRALHADFYQIFEDKAVAVDVPVKIEGFAKGVQAGGKLSVNMRRLKVKGFIKDLPDFLPVNVDEVGLGKAIQVGELSYENLELLNAKSAVVAQVRLTRAARAAAQQQG
jgi:large subunit ribosomal protein L25